MFNNYVWVAPIRHPMQKVGKLLSKPLILFNIPYTPIGGSYIYKKITRIVSVYIEGINLPIGCMGCSVITRGYADFTSHTRPYAKNRQITQAFDFTRYARSVRSEDYLHTCPLTAQEKRIETVVTTAA